MRYEEEIRGLREQNDRLNAEIVENIAEWVRASKRIEAVKGRNMSDEAILHHVRRLAREHHLDADGVERVFHAIMGIRAKAEGKSR